MPFTTPKLSSARVRPSQRDGFDLIVPNASGGRGQYIVPWGSLRALFAPTLFDTLLMARFAELEAIDPSTVRQAVLEVAREGTAGRTAMAAAEAALAAEARGRNATTAALLRRLVQEVEPPEVSVHATGREQAGDLRRRAPRALTSLAARLRLDSNTIMATIEALARPFSATGLGERSLTARLPTLLSSLAHLREELAALGLGNEPGHPAAQLAILIECTLAHARITLDAAHNQAANLVELLIAWRADSASTQASLTRSEWLLDGWDRVCRVWFSEPTLAERLAALQEQIPLIPVMPQEAAGWSGLASVEHPVLAARAMVKHEDWRTGVGLLDVIARNEALLSLA